MNRLAFPIPGLGQTFVIQPTPDIPIWEVDGPGRISRAKRKKAQAAKKLKKLRRKQGR